MSKRTTTQCEQLFDNEVVEDQQTGQNDSRRKDPSCEVVAHFYSLEFICTLQAGGWYHTGHGGV